METEIDKVCDNTALTDTVVLQLDSTLPVQYKHDKIVFSYNRCH